ncbi:MAG: glycosyltransferase [Patescibacteria group bacterium]|nr:glycosyltransferase [Patescibacteria group bacterium]
MKKQLYVDAQVFQSEAWDRGAAKLAFSFIESLVAKPTFLKQWEVTFVFNNKLPNLDLRQDQVAKILGTAIQFVSCPLVTPAPGGTYAKAAAENRSILDKNLACTGAIYFMPWLFEHSIYPVFPTNSKKVLLFHDLIPYLFADAYLRTEEQQNIYFERFSELFICDEIVTNSETTRDDLIKYLGVNPERVTTVFGSGVDRSAVDPKMPPKLNEDRHIILLPSGDDFRKNNQRCIEAFSAFNAQNNHKYILAVTSFFSEGTKEQLSKLSQDVVFLGSISDAELRWLYQEAEIILFGPLYEGLGMPLLEAITEKSKRIACSNIHVFKEIVDEPYVTYFDPYDTASIIKALVAVADQRPMKQYPKLANFDKASSGARLLDVMDKMTVEKLKNRDIIKTPRIAIVGPDPRGYSSIGKFIQTLYPELANQFQCDFYFELSALTKGTPKPSYLPYCANWYPVEALNAEAYASYDAVWYHLGNSDYHIETIKRALLYPGYLVLHDTRLRGLFDQLVQRGHISVDRYNTETRFAMLREAEFITSLVNSAKGVLVHSSDAKQKVIYSSINNTNKNVTKLHLPITQGGQVFKPAELTIGFGGFATPRADDESYKMLEKMVGNPRFKSCRFELFGFNYDYDQLSAAMQKVFDDPRVRITTNLTDLQFQTKLSQLHLLINFRPNYFGETSLLTLEAMRYGVCVVLRDVGWFHEIPTSAACKVTQQPEVFDAVAAFVSDRESLDQIKKAAIEYTAGLTVSAYVQAMRDMMNAESRLTAMPVDYVEEWANGVSGQIQVAQVVRGDIK